MKVVVSIFGREYSIRTDKDAEYMRQVALYVDAKMKEVAHRMPSLSTAQVAVLAALNLVDELLTERNEREAMLDQNSKRLAELTDSLARKIEEYRGNERKLRKEEAGEEEEDGIHIADR
jgi:cell division protein ZapA